MTVEQISVFVENKSGQLGEITRVLAEAGVNIRALSLADTADFGVLRFMADNTEKAKKVLSAAGLTVGSTPVVAVDVADKPGGLGTVLNILSEYGINVEYLYAFLARTARHAYVVLRVPDNQAAEAVLTAAGYHLILEEDLKKL